jgi:hypothetical protein
MADRLVLSDLAGFLHRADPDAPLSPEEATADAKALAMIRSNVSDDSCGPIIEATTPREAWDRLRVVHLNLSMARLSSTKADFQNLRQGTSENINCYFARAEALARLLRGMDSPCSEVDLCIQILLGLHKVFAVVKQVILTQADLQPLSTLRLLPQLLTAEGHLSAAVEPKVYSASVGGVPRSKTANFKGMDSSPGFDAPRYSGNWLGSAREAENKRLPFRPASMSREPARVRKPPICWHCGVEGHRFQECRKLGASGSRSAAAAVADAEPCVTEIACSRVKSFSTAADPALADMTEWIVDSGCTRSMTGSSKFFVSPLKDIIPVTITFANGETTTATQEGTIEIRSEVGTTLTVKNVLHVPEGLAVSLISVTQLTADGFRVSLGNTHVSIIHKATNICKFTGDVSEGLYVLRHYPLKLRSCNHSNLLPSLAAATSTEVHKSPMASKAVPLPVQKIKLGSYLEVVKGGSADTGGSAKRAAVREGHVSESAPKSVTWAEASTAPVGTSTAPAPPAAAQQATVTLHQRGNLWHRNLGHLGKADISRMVKENLVTGMPTALDHDSTICCDTCELCKMHRPPFPESTTRTEHPLELTHMDLMGPLTPSTAGGARYVSTITDDFSGYSHISLLKHKSDAEVHLQDTLTMRTEAGRQAVV